jgi:hypothetical protein
MPVNADSSASVMIAAASARPAVIAASISASSARTWVRRSTCWSRPGVVRAVRTRVTPASLTHGDLWFG